MKRLVWPAAPRRGGFTLVELLVAATLALVVMAALASLFRVFSRTLSDGQDLVQLAGRLRSVSWRLRQDLQGATMDVKPFIRPESAGGYLEIVEGPMVETGPAMDVDDILMLTTASPGRPFTGLIALTTPTTANVQTVGLESPVAEVAWFCKQGRRTDDGVQLYNLYRRQLLVAPVPGVGMMAASSTTPYYTGTTPPLGWDMFFLTNDLSVRREHNTLVANSLADLTRRQSRFMHWVSGTGRGNASTPNSGIPSFHHTWPWITSGSLTTSGTSEVLTGAREGEDLLLSNVVGFDIRVFDPQPVVDGAGNIVIPYGAYVDPGRLRPGATLATPLTSGMPFAFAAPLPTPPQWYASPPAGAVLYDTWSMHVEFNGQNFEPAGSAIDKGTNLVDTLDTTTGAFNGVIDDVGELRTLPPYFVPLRGVEIRIRCYEPSSQEVRQITVQHSFLAR